MTGMSLIVKTVARWLKGFILLVGIYFTLYGHIEHSGGFAGGVIIACAFILVFIAEGKQVETRLLSKNVASAFSSLGALLFLGTAAAGTFTAGIFFKNFITTVPAQYFRLLSSGTMLLLNISVAVMVSTTLFVVFVILSAIKIEVPLKPGGSDDDEKETNL
ncbi:MnhB domain-containing protein [candidate division FCPU426 bacterium]|nr:MnhB domain-containing protein [candidate division FCPU426 bacterium]